MGKNMDIPSKDDIDRKTVNLLTNEAALEQAFHNRQMMRQIITDEGGREKFGKYTEVPLSEMLSLFDGTGNLKPEYKNDMDNKPETPQKKYRIDDTMFADKPSGLTDIEFVLKQIIEREIFTNIQLKASESINRNDQKAVDAFINFSNALEPVINSAVSNYMTKNYQLMHMLVMIRLASSLRHQKAEAGNNDSEFSAFIEFADHLCKELANYSTKDSAREKSLDELASTLHKACTDFILGGKPSAKICQEVISSVESTANNIHGSLGLFQQSKLEKLINKSLGLFKGNMHDSTPLPSTR